MMDCKLIRQKLKAAQSAKEPIRSELEEAGYHFFHTDWLMNRDSMDSPADYSQITQLDNTGAVALNELTDDIISTIFPLERPFLRLVRDEEEIYDEELGDVEEAFHRAIKYSNFFPAVRRAMKSALLSMGCLIMMQSNNRRSAFHFIDVPFWSCYFVQSEIDQLQESFVRRKMTWAEIEANYSQFATADEPLKKVGEFKHIPDEEIATTPKEVYQYFKTNMDGTTDYCLFCVAQEKQAAGDDGGIIFQKEGMDNMRFIAFAYDRVSGSVMGAGPAFDILPDQRALNYSKFYGLQNTQRALGAVYYGDHNKINFERLNDPQQIKTLHVGDRSRPPQILQGNTVPFESSMFVVDSLAEDIKSKAGVAVLPKASQGDRRSAEEFIARQNRHARSMVPKNSNLHKELFEPLVECGLTILQKSVYINTKFYVPAPTPDEETGFPLYSYEPENYLVMASKKQLAEEWVQGVATMFQVFPEEAQVMLNTNAAAKDMMKFLNLPDKFVNTEERQTQIRQEIAELKQLQAQAGQAPQGSAPQTTPLERR